MLLSRARPFCYFLAPTSMLSRAPSLLLNLQPHVTCSSDHLSSYLRCPFFQARSRVVLLESLSLSLFLSFSLSLFLSFSLSLLCVCFSLSLFLKTFPFTLSRCSCNMCCLKQKCRWMEYARLGTMPMIVLVDTLQRGSMWISASTFADTITLLDVKRS